MSWIQTFTGKHFNPLEIEKTQLSIIDIAHSLSNLCRFAGHVPKFYSVAQHSIYVSQILKERGLPPRAQLHGLLHDATEAYLIDMPQPIKRLKGMQFYCDLENLLWEKISAHFEIGWEFARDVKRADIQCLAAEARDLMGDPQDWDSILTVTPPEFMIEPVSPEQAKHAFLDRYLGIINEMRANRMTITQGAR